MSDLNTTVEEETAMNEAAKIAMRETFMRITSLPPDQVIPYLTIVLQTAFELLRDGGKQDDFVHGLLDGAREQMKQPSFLTMKDLRVN
ncbi:MAG: hypothetical protein WA777_15185 [Rhodanobacter sp.]